MILWKLPAGKKLRMMSVSSMFHEEDSGDYRSGFLVRKDFMLDLREFSNSSWGAASMMKRSTLTISYVTAY